MTEYQFSNLIGYLQIVTFSFKQRQCQNEMIIIISIRLTPLQLIVSKAKSDSLNRPIKQDRNHERHQKPNLGGAKQ